MPLTQPVKSRISSAPASQYRHRPAMISATATTVSSGVSAEVADQRRQPDSAWVMPAWRGRSSRSWSVCGPSPALPARCAGRPPADIESSVIRWITQSPFASSTYYHHAVRPLRRPPHRRPDTSKPVADAARACADGSPITEQPIPRHAAAGEVDCAAEDQRRQRRRITSTNRSTSSRRRWPTRPWCRPSRALGRHPRIMTTTATYEAPQPAAADPVPARPPSARRASPKPDHRRHASRCSAWIDASAWPTSGSSAADRLHEHQDRPAQFGPTSTRPSRAGVGTGTQRLAAGAYRQVRDRASTQPRTRFQQPRRQLHRHRGARTAARFEVQRHHQRERLASVVRTKRTKNVAAGPHTSTRDNPWPVVPAPPGCTEAVSSTSADAAAAAASGASRPATTVAQPSHRPTTPACSSVPHHRG